MKAFIFDPLWDELVSDDLLKKLQDAGIESIVTKEIAPLSDCQALFEGDDARILCINPDYVGWKLSMDDYKDIPSLKAILTCVTSFSWIDTTLASSKQIPVCNVRNYSTDAVAEAAMMMLFNVARQIPRLIKDGFPLDFDKDFMKYRGVELHGKTVGIVGLGNIGAGIARRCAGLGINVTYWSRSPKDTEYQYKELVELFAESDVILPALAVNDDTKSVITDELLTSMKPSAMLVTVVRELFNEQLAIDMVNDGKLFGFGYEDEPASFNSHEGNVWAAPAYAWVTQGAMDNCMQAWTTCMTDAAAGSYPNKVN